MPTHVRLELRVLPRDENRRGLIHQMNACSASRRRLARIHLMNEPMNATKNKLGRFYIDRLTITITRAVRPSPRGHADGPVPGRNSPWLRCRRRYRADKIQPQEGETQRWNPFLLFKHRRCQLTVTSFLLVQHFYTAEEMGERSANGLSASTPIDSNDSPGNFP